MTAGSGGSQWTGGVEGVLYCRTEMKVAVKLVECVECIWLLLLDGIYVYNILSRFILI